MEYATTGPQECIVLATQASLCVRYAMGGIRMTRTSRPRGFTKLLIGKLIIFVIFSEFCVSRVL